MTGKHDSIDSTETKALLQQVHMLGVIIYRQGQNHGQILSELRSLDTKVTQLMKSSASSSPDPLWKRLPWDKIVGLLRIFGPLAQPYILALLAWGATVVAVAWKWGGAVIEMMWRMVRMLFGF